ncbi:hypothetical protein JX266_001313 [Neoarthrinium moseri]|nr:hypothetical protein JX266_001313 [Neoarthrinium moseri]
MVKSRHSNASPSNLASLTAEYTAEYNVNLVSENRLDGNMDIDEAASDLASKPSSIFDQSCPSDDQVLDDDALTAPSKDSVLIADTSWQRTGFHFQSYDDSGLQLDRDNHNPESSVKVTSALPNRPTRCLQDELFAALTSTQQETRGFFAKGQLSKILTEERVQHELATYFEDSLAEDTIAEYAKTICHGTGTQEGSPCHDQQNNNKSYVKILAVLILIQKTRAIVKLLADPSGVNDSDLPLIKTPQPDNKGFYDLRARRQPDKTLKCFHTKWWNQFEICNFNEWQWTTLPFTFGRPLSHTNDIHHELEKQRILPFIGNNQTELEGGFARVFKVSIHPEHHSFHINPGELNNAYFAVKRLHSQSKIAFGKEVEILKKFSGDKHPHLISLLATYEQSNQFFLLFDWAETDLQTYWTRKNPSFDMETVLWMARQCKGIAHGITKIHEHVTTHKKPGSSPAGNLDVVFGHHGDIKPENVLWFAELNRENHKAAGTLKLSDFGLAEFSVHQTLSMTERSKWGVSLGYRAPETDLKPEAAIGRSYDVWTLGCLYLEFITWMLGGRKLLDDFVKQRRSSDPMWHYMETTTFFELEVCNGKRTAVIKPTVKKVIPSSRFNLS